MKVACDTYETYSKTAGRLHPCMLDLDRDAHFNYGGRVLLDGRWQHCITTMNISLYTWVYKCHIHEYIWQNKGEWPKWAEMWLYTECYITIYKWIDIVGNLAKNTPPILYLCWGLPHLIFIEMTPLIFSFLGWLILMWVPLLWEYFSLDEVLLGTF